MAALVPPVGEHVDLFRLGSATGAHIMRKIIISTTAAVTLFSLGALAQKPSQGIASIPDFSGIWARLSFPGFEPLASGPTSLVNRARSPNGAGEVSQLVGDYTNPILKPQAAG